MLFMHQNDTVINLLYPNSPTQYTPLTMTLFYLELLSLKEVVPIKTTDIFVQVY